MKRAAYLFVVFLSLFLVGRAQDIHFTQWMHAPHTYNPAEIGNFTGDHRFHGNYRNQWSSVTVPFSTTALMADSKALTKNRNLGLAANLLYDVTGDSKFTTTGISVGASYKFKFKGDSTGEISFGVQPSFTQKKLDLSGLNFDNQFNGNFFDPSLPIGESLQRFSRWYFDVAIGARLFYSLNGQNSIEVGASAYNLLNPKQSFFNEDNTTLDSRFNSYFKWNHTVGKRVVVQPGLLYSKQGTFSSFNVGGIVYYDLSESKFLTKKVFFGLYGRTKDSGDLLAGLIYDRWTFGGSYDFNLSTLVPASNVRGGFEIAVIYIIGSRPKRPEYKSCPPYL